MFLQPLQTRALADAHIADLHRATDRPRHEISKPARETTSLHLPLPARRRAGWWLVAVGLRLAVGPAVGSLR